MKQGRTAGATFALWCVFAEVVLFAAVGNQWLTKSVQDWVDRRHTFGLVEGLVGATQTYDWRFTPRANDVQHGWAASLVMLAVVFLVTALLLFGLARGRVSRGRAFWTALLTVVFATQVGLVAGGLVLDPFGRRYADYLPATKYIGSGPYLGLGPTGSGASHRIAAALFGQMSPNGYTFLGSVAFGILVGLVAMVVAGRVRGYGDQRFPSRPASPAPGVSPTPATSLRPVTDPQPGMETGRHSREG